MLQHPGLFARLSRKTRIFRNLNWDKIAPVLIALIILAAYSIGGESWLIGAAVTLPILYLFVGGIDLTHSDARSLPDGLTGLMRRPELEDHIELVLRDVRNKGQNSANFLVELDDFRQLNDRYGDAAAEQVLRRVSSRISAGLRDTDIVARTGDCQFAICLNPVRHLDLEICIQLAARLQASVEEPVTLDATTLYSSCSVGFCMASRVPDITTESYLRAAELALKEAQRAGPSAIRAYSDDMRRTAVKRDKLHDEASSALANGQIRAWFQPQVSTDTGHVTGFEALARWEHPERGTIPPIEFLETLEQTGQLERLADLMLHQSLTALRAWESAGYIVPQVGVNFAGDELRNPSLIDKIKWEMDRFDITPDRIAIEVLETVVANSPDDIIARNINGLAKLGCRIDLDDFGTGHASISSIRRFAVSRLKIDRSFVMKADQDPEQQRLIAAIVTMAERLGMDTLAEGVETAGEHAILAQLGCAHVQGYGIARPMPFSKTMAWMQKHTAKLETPPQIGRETG
jgi:diguanylate cyclase (GGDEF)-like protein